MALEEKIVKEIICDLGSFVEDPKIRFAVVEDPKIRGRPENSVFASFRVFHKHL
jgi:hypothetical protein